MTIKQVHEKLQSQVTPETRELHLTDKEFKMFYKNLNDDIKKMYEMFPFRKVCYRGIPIVIINHPS